MNVLLDDNMKAVLCDFGLSRLKADATSRTVRPASSVVVGSRNWMAPECILGGSSNKPADIYAFAMMIYEVNHFCIFYLFMRLIMCIDLYQPNPTWSHQLCGFC
jgi:serine/threonine protein kinase